MRQTTKKAGAVVANVGYVYDGWNVVAEYDLSAATTLTATNIWGLDLSNMRQQAGGIGGLLSRRTGGQSYAYTYDGSGNVSEMLADSGTVAVHYDYDPFGKETTSVGIGGGDAVSGNPYRFSTKPVDATSGLVYFGYRFYDAETGRWPSRDPIEEDGGINLYGYVGNNPENSFDLLGLKCTGDANLDDPLVRQAIKDAWEQSLYQPGSKIPFVPEWFMRSGERTEREHSFNRIVNPSTGASSVTGLRMHEKISGDYIEPKNSVAGFHTHPYGGSPQPSEGKDIPFAEGRGRPEYMIGKDSVGRWGKDSSGDWGYSEFIRKDIDDVNEKCECKKR